MQFIIILILKKKRSSEIGISASRASYDAHAMILSMSDSKLQHRSIL